MSVYKRMIFVAMVASVFCTAIGTSDATDNGRRYRAQQRATIRAMPILERPSRPGHFYGNAVRRNAAPEPKQSLTDVGRADAKPAATSAKNRQPVTALLKAPSGFEASKLPTARSETEVRSARPLVLIGSKQSVTTQPPNVRLNQ